MALRLREADNAMKIAELEQDISTLKLKVFCLFEYQAFRNISVVLLIVFTV